MLPSALPAFSAPNAVSAGPFSCLASSAVTSACSIDEPQAHMAATAKAGTNRFMGFSPRAVVVDRCDGVVRITGIMPNARMLKLILRGLDVIQHELHAL